MAEVLFNTHDLVLIGTVFVCLFCVACVAPSQCRSQSFVYTSIGFFVSSAAIALDILIDFGAAFHSFVVSHAPALIFTFEFGAWLQAPFGFLMIASLLDKDFQFKPIYGLLFLPFVLQSLHQLVVYQSLPFSIKLTSDQVPEYYNHSSSWFFVQLSREIFRFCLALMAGRLLVHWWKRTHAQHPAHWPMAITGIWISTTFLSVLVALQLLVNREWALSLPVGDVGLTQNYFTFAGLTFALYCYVRDALLQRPVTAIHLNKHKEDTNHVNPVYIEKLEQLMNAQKLFTDPDLNLETLAKQMNISSRTLSGVINGHFGCSFTEYINRYRLNEAKRLLLEKRSTTVLNIMYAAGFNSKATFNGAFKRAEGITPSQYRKHQLKSVTTPIAV